MFEFNQNKYSIDLGESKIIWHLDYPILIPKRFSVEQEKYIKASLRTLHYGNVSVDHVLKTYYSDFNKIHEHNKEVKQKSEVYKYEKLVDAFLDFQKKIFNEYKSTLSQVDFNDAEESMFYCGLIYKKLYSNFQALRMLINFGFYYETFSLIRQMLEQIAFAFEVFHKKSFDDYESPTKCISSLKKFYPYAGTFYGELSSKTHIDKSQFINHYTVNEKKEGNIILRSLEFSADTAFDSSIILDTYVCVFEFIFFESLKEHKSLTLNKKIRKNRPTKVFHNKFKKAYLQLLK